MATFKAEPKSTSAIVVETRSQGPRNVREEERDGRDSQRGVRGLAWRKAILLGVTTSLCQLWLCLLASGSDSFASAYAGFARWDSQWYEHISRMGYLSSIPPVRWNPQVANVAFFPGFPIWSRIVARVLAIDHATALVVAAQIMAAVFWVLFYALISRWIRSWGALILTMLLVATHPAAFFLQVGYSESLFLAALLGFLLTTSAGFFSSPFVSPLGAASIGIVMTATRIVGAPLAFVGVLVPTIDLLRNQRQRRSHSRDVRQDPDARSAAPRTRAWHELVRQGAIGSLSLIGIGSFFAYCWWQWGRWDLYMWTQEIGWGLKPDYSAIFHPSSWMSWQLASGWWPQKVNPDELSRLATSAYLVLLSGTAAAEILIRARGRSASCGFRDRLPFYAAAAMMMFVSVSGLAGASFRSMIRYTFPVHVCWVIGIVGMVHALPERFRSRPRLLLIAIGLAIGIYAFVLQIRFLEMFTHWHWVA